MKFGKLEDIGEVDFTLPEDHPQTKALLQKLAAVDRSEFYIGGTQFGRKEWVGKWIPPKTKSTDYLDFTSRMFNTIELNATHYRIFPENTIRTWRDKVPEGFRFCPKWPQSISHRRRFKNHEDMSEDFLRSIFNFSEKLGPCFIQLPPNFTINQAENVIEYLNWLPRDLKVALEFRHESWFDGNEVAESVFYEMEKLGVATCMSDTAGRRDAVNMRLTADFFILRFGGYSLDPSDYKRMDDWVKRFKHWTQNGVKEIYIFMHQPESLVTPETNAYFAEQLNKTFNANLPIPMPIDNQGTLF
tara:strand:- start:6692 stop:7594 length:903 start_codon:yes stop_codon:yes gene_type:complete